jgi:putative ABC transport system permease protein
MILLRLAIKNLIGAGIRSWLNAFVISLALVASIWNQSLLLGTDEQSTRASAEVEYGNGQYWQENYDPLDPLSLDNGHGLLPAPLERLVGEGRATPILITQATIYPQGRMRSVLLKGIDPAQKVLSIPSAALAAESEELPALIGARMAKASGLREGDTVTVRWREAGGAFNALEARIVRVMRTTIQTIDVNQLWIPLDRLQKMTRLEGQASLVVLGRNVSPAGPQAGWSFKDLGFLLKDIRQLVKTKSVGRIIMFTILMLLGMLAVFDTQVLSIFRRRKEMGTLMALGFTRGQVIRLFTLEGALHGVLAVLVGAVYGIPLMIYFYRHGFVLPSGTEGFGFSIGEKIFPVLSIGLVLSVTLLVLVVTTVVSFLPTRRIAKLKPTDALRGRLS